MSSRPQMSFKTTDVHNFKIAYPERDDETGQDSRLPDYVMLPTNESAKSPDSDAPIRADSDFIDSLNSPPDNLKTESIAEHIYFLQLKRIQDSHMVTSLKRGKVVDPGEKKIRLRQNPCLSHVRSTTGFFHHYCDDVKTLQMCEGPIHLIAELELDPLSIYTLILALKQENLVEVEIVTRMVRTTLSKCRSLFIQSMTLLTVVLGQVSVCLLTLLNSSGKREMDILIKIRMPTLQQCLSATCLLL